MSETHELPDDLNPVGDICYPLFIPDDVQYRHLVLGALSQLTIPEYYREFDFALADVETVCGVWTDRMLVPFVQAMNDEENCGVIEQLNTELKKAYKTDTQAIAAGIETSVLFTSGDHAAPPNYTRIRPLTGKIVLTAFVLVSAAVATQLTLSIRKNGTTDMVRQTFPNTALSQRMTVTIEDECDDDDYYELRVLTNQASTVQSSENAFLKWIRWYAT